MHKYGSYINGYKVYGGKYASEDINTDSEKLQLLLEDYFESGMGANDYRLESTFNQWASQWIDEGEPLSISEDGTVTLHLYEFKMYKDGYVEVYFDLMSTLKNVVGRDTIIQRPSKRTSVDGNRLKETITVNQLGRNIFTTEVTVTLHDPSNGDTTTVGTLDQMW